MKKTKINEEKNQKPFSYHAKIRLAQREILPQVIEEVIENGEKLVNSVSTTHTDESTIVVTGKNNKIITLLENKRNTRFDLLNKTQLKEQKLLDNIQHNPKNDHAMCELAELYLSGELGNQNIKKAHELLLTAARRGKGNSHAMCLLAKMYEDGDLGVPDLNTSLKWLEKAAKKNNRYALAIIGQRYLSLSLFEKAQHYFELSAKKGGTRAMWHLAFIYEKGLGKDKSLPKAIELYTKAAKMGSINSIYSLNKLYQLGELGKEVFNNILNEASLLIGRTSSGIAVSVGLAQVKGELGDCPEKGFELLEKAANKRNPEAIEILAKLYQKGQYCPVDLIRSQYWFNELSKLYELAAEKGNVQAICSLGYLYLNGKLEKISNDTIEKARSLFLKAAQRDDIDSILTLAELYLDGLLGDYPLSEGLHWVEKAIVLCTERAHKEGDIDAAVQLADIYMDNQLGVKSYSKATELFTLVNNPAAIISWYKKLAEFNSDALYKLGKIYEKGLFQKPAIRAAAVYYLAAAEKGNLKAARRLANLCMDYIPIELQNQIAKYLSENEQENKTENKKAEEYYRLGADYYRGTSGKTKDIFQAVYYLRKAANYEHTNALFALAKLYESGEIGTHVKPVAINFYKRAAKCDHYLSVKALIHHYQKGFLTPINPVKEQKWHLIEEEYEDEIPEKIIKANLN